MLRWISAFLNDRIFVVKINNKFSLPHNVQSGVPQGSVLGPLLFLLYINDLSDYCSVPKVQTKMFADDVKLYSPCASSLSNSFNKLIEWSDIWKLKIAPDKTLVLYLGTKNPKHSYNISEKLIPEESCVRDLGVHIDNQLSFKQHINKLIYKLASYKAHLLFRTLKTKQPNTWSLAYKSYVRPLLVYATIIWNPKYKNQIPLLESVQSSLRANFFQDAFFQHPPTITVSNFCVLNL